MLELKENFAIGCMRSIGGLLPANDLVVGVNSWLSSK